MGSSRSIFGRLRQVLTVIVGCVGFRRAMIARASEFVQLFLVRCRELLPLFACAVVLFEDRFDVLRELFDSQVLHVMYQMLCRFPGVSGTRSPVRLACAITVCASGSAAIHRVWSARGRGRRGATGSLGATGFG